VLPRLEVAGIPSPWVLGVTVNRPQAALAAPSPGLRVARWDAARLAIASDALAIASAITYFTAPHGLTVAPVSTASLTSVALGARS
jgi:hypothetical protein